MTSQNMTDTFQKSQELLRRAETCDAWAANRVRNYSQIDGAYPFYADHAKGAYLWDVDGNRYIDYTLGYGTIVLGHADERVNKAVVEELAKGVCVSPLWKPAQVELTALLTSVIPQAEMAFLMKTGSDATSGAVRLARAFTGRDKVVRWGYNGWHDWATPRPVGVPKSIQADSMSFQYGNVELLRSIFDKYPDQIACIIMMPFELEKPWQGFLNEVRTIAHENGALFILDEMRSGFRLALGGAQEYFSVSADLATYSKSMSNGYPISAIVGRSDVLDGIGRTKMTSTYFGNSAEMLAAITTISILKETDAIRHIWAMGEIFEKGITSLIKEYSIPANFAGYPPYPYIMFDDQNSAESARVKTSFYKEVTRHGVLFHPNHHWYISAAHTMSDIMQTLDICRQAFAVIRSNVRD
jgi:glutamate-1-semialdehyde 2,1-aminomutase